MIKIYKDQSFVIIERSASNIQSYTDTSSWFIQQFESEAVEILSLPQSDFRRQIPFRVLQHTPASQIANENGDPIGDINDVINYLSSVLISTNSAAVVYSYFAEDYDELVTISPAAQQGQLAYVRNQQGTPWLPGSFGGTYRPKGAYLYDGAQWVSDKNNVALALQQIFDELDIIQNQPPVITVFPPTNEINLYDSYVFQVVASGVNNVYSLVGAPAGMVIDPNNGLITFSSTVLFSGLVTIVVTNPGGTDQQMFQFDVVGNPAIRPATRYYFDVERLIGFNNGDPVPVLTDFSGNPQNEPIQNTPALQAIYEVGATPQGFPAIDFNDSAYAGEISIPFTEAGNTIFFVARTDIITQNQYLAYFYSGGNTRRASYEWRATDDIRFRTNNILTAADKNTTQWAVWAFVWNPGGTGGANNAQKRIYRNGSRVAANGGAAPQPTGLYRIGSDNNNNQLMTGQIAHIHMIGEALTHAEIVAISAQLQAKYL